MKILIILKPEQNVSQIASEQTDIKMLYSGNNHIIKRQFSCTEFYFSLNSLDLQCI